MYIPLSKVLELLESIPKECVVSGNIVVINTETGEIIVELDTRDGIVTVDMDDDIPF